MAKTKKESTEQVERQRRQTSSAVDLAREEGMTGNRPGGATVKPSKSDTKPEA